MMKRQQIVQKIADFMRPPPSPRLGWAKYPKTRFYIGRHSRWVLDPDKKRIEKLEWGNFHIGFWPWDWWCSFSAYGTGWNLRLFPASVHYSYGNGGRWTRGLLVSFWRRRVLRIGHRWMPD